jgi:hypothetical protein
MPSCYTPFIGKVNGDDQPFPCGKCPACRARRASGWSFRLVQHGKYSHYSQFITLTYDTRHVPISRKGRLTLRPVDLQLFFKRLRKAHGKAHNNATPIKYFAIGEYGGRTWRPHYHIIIFNCKPELIQDAWQKGQVHYGNVSGASIGYTLKYVMKPKKVPQYKGDDRVPEMQLISKGLGLPYLSPQIINYHKQHFSRMVLQLEEGKLAAMPRYYKNKIYDETTRSLYGVMQRQCSLQREAEAIRQAGSSEAYADEQRRRMEAAYEKMWNSKNQATCKL